MWDQIRETKKVKQTKKQTNKKHPCKCICEHKYCLQSFLAETKHLIKKIFHLMYGEKRNTDKCVRSQQ